MYNLFYIESPLQMLSAISACNKFNKYKSILIINLSCGDRVNNDTQILELIGDEWSEVYIQRSTVSTVVNLLGLMKFLIVFGFRFKGKIDRYFIGEFRSLDMAILKSVILPKETILLDDGAFTITAQNYYIKNGISPYEKSKKYKVLKCFLKRKFIPNLYTFFKFDVSLLPGQINYFEFPVRKEINTNKKHVFFFGSKLSESQNMILADEIEVLSKVIKIFSDYIVFYIPHRDESQDKLNLISKLGFHLKILGKPAEIYFEEVDVMPEIVVSCYSTVLYTCYLKFLNVQLYSIDIESLLLKDSTRVNAKEIYKYYEGLGIRKILI